MGRIGHWIISLIGYGLYTLAVVVLLLWFLFPTDSFRVWLERQLTDRNPSLTWAVEDVRLAWPLSLIAMQMEARESQAAEPVFTVDSVKVRPDLGGLTDWSGTVPLAYIMKLHSGSVNGNIAFSRESDSVDGDGEINNVKLEDLQNVWQKFGRPVSGTMKGTFTYQGQWKNLLTGKLQAELQLQDGSFGLRQRIMGLESLEYRQLDASFSLENRVITVDKGRVESDMFAAGFAGSVDVSEDLLASDLNIKGWFEPRPELLSTLKDQTIVRLVKSQLRDDKLNFTLTDTLMMPGISFEGASGVIDGLIQGGAR